MEPVLFKLDVDISTDSAMTDSCTFPCHIVAVIMAIKDRERVRSKRHVKNLFPSLKRRIAKIQLELLRAIL